jgi:hypothetical protein
VLPSNTTTRAKDKETRADAERQLASFIGKFGKDSNLFVLFGTLCAKQSRQQTSWFEFCSLTLALLLTQMVQLAQRARQELERGSSEVVLAVEKDDNAFEAI